MTLCVIPARGGSKRVPRKNVRPFAGRPMIEWSIAAALESGVFDRVAVSTDDPEIAEVARAAGAHVPFARPAALADDHTPTIPVIRHAIEALDAGAGPVCCLYATAPFVRAADLAAGLALLRRSGARFVLPVATFPFPVQRAVTLRRDGRMEMLHPEHALTRSQDLPETWHDAGQFYWGTRDAWFGEAPLIGPDSAALPLPRHRVQDIDTPEDWDRAEALFRAGAAA
ncbi:pseudaminic acid cytidylyltransferase [Jannaschia sp. LMIT008]|uniref:pseudaminic acid cytidylyltransferase n=1 Tax=Jannaschia maritima TaxID=3032585 RepID=UPI00281115DF|nr:pseudaminic acid cytidylyltransferase [Jannaschia sp. LMIT008]